MEEGMLVEDMECLQYHPEDPAPGGGREPPAHLSTLSYELVLSGLKLDIKRSASSRQRQINLDHSLRIEHSNKRLGRGFSASWKMSFLRDNGNSSRTNNIRKQT
jgi:hypothetical protein